MLLFKALRFCFRPTSKLAMWLLIDLTWRMSDKELRVAGTYIDTLLEQRAKKARR